MGILSASLALRKFITLLCLIGISLLSACATTQPISKQLSANPVHFAKLEQVQQFKLKGRIGIQMPGRGYTGSFKWQHQAHDTDEISFFSPVGSQVAHITQTPKLATLTDNKGNTFQAANATALIEEHLGWQIPVNDLNDWLLARATADAKTSQTLDPQGRLTKLQKRGWSIDYANYRTWNKTDLPGKITLSKPDFSLKLIIKHWQVNP